MKKDVKGSKTLEVSVFSPFRGGGVNVKSPNPDAVITKRWRLQCAHY